MRRSPDGHSCGATLVPTCRSLAHAIAASARVNSVKNRLTFRLAALSVRLYDPGKPGAQRPPRPVWPTGDGWIVKRLTALKNSPSLFPTRSRCCRCPGSSGAHDTSCASSSPAPRRSWPAAAHSWLASHLNCFLTPSYDPLETLAKFTRLLQGAGGHLEQTLAYLDPFSAAAYLRLCQQHLPVTTLRTRMPLQRAAQSIARCLGGERLISWRLGPATGCSKRAWSSTCWTPEYPAWSSPAQPARPECDARPGSWRYRASRRRRAGPCILHHDRAPLCRRQRRSQLQLAKSGRPAIDQGSTS